MTLYSYIFIFVVGLVLGSFFNAFIFRFNTGLSVTRGRSRCRNCKSTIRWFDLVPVISFLFLKGECRNCKKQISFVYPVTELVTALAVLTFFTQIKSFDIIGALNLTIILTLILIAFTDIMHFIIPDNLVILLVIAAIILKLATGANLLLLSTFALGLSAFFAILFIISKGKWLGFGDVKLTFAIALILGYPLGYLSVVLAIWAATVFSLILIVAKKADLKTAIPLGSFLSFSTVVFIIFNSEIQKIAQYF